MEKENWEKWKRNLMEREDQEEVTNGKDGLEGVVGRKVMERKDWEEWRRGNCWKGKSRRNEEERTVAGKGTQGGMDRRKIMEREDWEKWKRRKKLEK